MTPDPAELPQAVARGVCRLVAGHLSAAEREQQLDDLADLYAEHTDVRHPLDPLRMRPLTTRAELREHFASAGGGGAVAAEEFRPTRTVVHRTDDPEVAIVEFSYVGRASGRDFELPAVFVVRVRDGVIVESRDYVDHVGLACAFGFLDRLVDGLRAS